MLGKKTEPTPEAGASAQSIEEKREQVRALLRNADKLIKEGQLPEARAEIEKARAIDPKNVYASAFEERLTTLESGGEKDKAKHHQPPKTAHSSPMTAPQSQANQEHVGAATLEVLKKEIERTLEQKYKEKFAQEIQKAEKRVALVLEEEEEKLAQERIHMLEQLQKERSSYQQQIEEQFQHKLQEELHLAEEKHQQQLADQRQHIENEIREQINAQHSAQLKELQKAIEREKAGLMQEQQQSIHDVKRQLEEEHASRLNAELQKIKDTSGEQRKEVIRQVEASLRTQLQSEYEQHLNNERTTIEQRYQSLQKELERSFEQRQQELLKENERVIETRIKEQLSERQKVFDRELDETKKSLQREHEEQFKQTLSDERKRIESELHGAIESERASLEQERNKLLEEEQSKLEDVRQTMKQQMEVDLQTRLTEMEHEAATNYEYKMNLLGIEIPKTRDEKMKVYSERLREIWSEGPLTMEKAQRLMEIQDILEIGFEEHVEIEADVRLQLYAATVEQAILGGRLKPTDRDALDEVKQRFEITADEASNLEPIILSAFQRAATKGIIFVVDDDEFLVRIIEQRLREIGYQVVTSTSLTKAMEQVERIAIDLILCDIRFEGEKIDGFTFFKFCQQHPQLKKIPFVLMSSLDEGLFIRTGIQLGVDDYLTKPLDIELVTAVIEGKLKKYRSLRMN